MRRQRDRAAKETEIKQSIIREGHLNAGSIPLASWMLLPEIAEMSKALPAIYPSTHHGESKPVSDEKEKTSAWTTFHRNEIFDKQIFKIVFSYVFLSTPSKNKYRDTAIALWRVLQSTSTALFYNGNRHQNPLADRAAKCLFKLLTFTQINALNVTNHSISLETTEALVNALPNSLIESLSFSNCRLDNAALTTLINGLPETRVHSLNLSGTNINSDDAFVIAQALQNPRCKLTELYLNDTKIDDEGVVEIFDALNQSRLKALHINGIENLSEDTLSVLNMSLKSSQISTLSITSHNPLTQSDFDSLIQALPGSSITTLHLKNFGDNPNSKIACAKNLAKTLPFTQITHLIVEEDIGNVGITAILKALPVSRITTLEIPFCNTRKNRTLFQNAIMESYTIASIPYTQHTNTKTDNATERLNENRKRNALKQAIIDQNQHALLKLKTSNHENKLINKINEGLIFFYKTLTALQRFQQEINLLSVLNQSNHKNFRFNALSVYCDRQHEFIYEQITQAQKTLLQYTQYLLENLIDGSDTSILYPPLNVLLYHCFRTCITPRTIKTAMNEIHFIEEKLQINPNAMIRNFDDALKQMEKIDGISTNHTHLPFFYAIIRENVNSLFHRMRVYYDNPTYLNCLIKTTTLIVEANKKYGKEITPPLSRPTLFSVDRDASLNCCSDSKMTIER